MAGLIISNTPQFKGIVPNAMIAIYRVFGCEGITQSFIILQAMKQAINDDVDIIVLPTIVYSSKYFTIFKNMISIAAEKKIVVIASVGNGNNINAKNKDIVFFFE
jgi:hypothetical protein